MKLGAMLIALCSTRVNYNSTTPQHDGINNGLLEEKIIEEQATLKKIFDRSHYDLIGAQLQMTELQTQRIIRDGLPKKASSANMQAAQAEVKKAGGVPKKASSANMQVAQTEVKKAGIETSKLEIIARSDYDIYANPDHTTVDYLKDREYVPKGDDFDKIDGTSIEPMVT